MQFSLQKKINSVLKDLQKKAQEGGDDKEGLKFLRKLASLVNKKVIVRDNGSLMLENRIPFTECPKCGGDIVHESELQEAKKKKKAKKSKYHGKKKRNITLKKKRKATKKHVSEKKRKNTKKK